MKSIIKSIEKKFNIYFSLFFISYVGSMCLVVNDLNERINKKNSETHMNIVLQKTKGYLKSFTRDSDSLRDSLYFLEDKDEIIKSVVNRIEKTPGILSVGIILNDGGFINVARENNGDISVYYQTSESAPLKEYKSNRIIYESFDYKERPWYSHSENDTTYWTKWYRCYANKTVPCLSFVKRTQPEEKNKFAFDLIYFNLNVDEFSNQLSMIENPNEDIYLISSNGAIIGGSTNLTSSVIYKNRENIFQISRDPDAYYAMHQKIDGISDTNIHYFHYNLGFIENINVYFILFVLFYALSIPLSWLLFIVLIRHSLRYSDAISNEIVEMTESIYKNEVIEINKSDTREIIELKSLIQNIQHKYQSRIKSLLNMTSHNNNNFIIDKSVIKINSHEYVSAAVISLYGTENHRKAYGTKNFDSSLSLFHKNIADGFNGDCEVLLLSPTMIIILCVENNDVFYKNIELLDIPFFNTSRKQVYIHKVVYQHSFNGKSIDLITEMMVNASDYISNREEDVFFTYEQLDNVKMNQNRWCLENIKNAIKDEEFYIIFQPIVNLCTKKTIGAEALCRWHSKEKGEIPPSVFIPIAEKTGLIKELGDYIIVKSIKDFSEFCKFYNIFKDIILHINVSPLQLNEEYFYKKVLHALKKYKIRSSSICIEITETPVQGESEYFYENIYKLKENGIKIAIDDFGCGLGDIKKLYKIKPDCIKIDNELTEGIFDKTRNIVKFIARYAKDEDVPVIAEGVEKLSEVNELEKMGVTQVQGYFFQKPLPFSKWDTANLPQQEK
ncbi:EAL domain-containing protein [Escherichia coli]